MDLECGKYEVVHGGFDAKFANEDPDRVLPWTRCAISNRQVTFIRCTIPTG